jgi:hypothetical protein
LLRIIIEEDAYRSISISVMIRFMHGSCRGVSLSALAPHPSREGSPTLQALQGAHRATYTHFLISTHHGKRDEIDAYKWLEFFSNL